jgi:hypothetical protein
MKASFVVENDPRGDSGSRLAPVGIVFQIDFLVIQGAPQALDEDIIHPAPAPVQLRERTDVLVVAPSSFHGRLEAKGNLYDKNFWASSNIVFAQQL